MDFVETKFFYKDHILEQNLNIENMSKKWLRKPKKCDFEQQHIQNVFTLEKYLNIIFEKLTQKLINFKVFSLEKYLKMVFSTENVWKLVKIKIDKIMKIKKRSNKKIVFSRPLDKYVLYLDPKLKNEIMSKKQPQKPKNCHSVLQQVQN